MTNKDRGGSVSICFVMMPDLPQLANRHLKNKPEAEHLLLGNHPSLQT